MIIIEQNDGQLISKRLIDFTTTQLIQLVQLENEKIVVIQISLLIIFLVNNISKRIANLLIMLSNNRK